MAVTAKSSSYTRKTSYTIAVVFVLAGLWFLYDGWLNETFQEENTRPDGTPNVTLQSNRIWIPVIFLLQDWLTVIAVYQRPIIFWRWK